MYFYYNVFLFMLILVGVWYYFICFIYDKIWDVGNIILVKSGFKNVMLVICV